MTSTTRTFASAPTTIGNTKPKSKYRDPKDGKPIANNIMWNKKIVRGNTYATQVLPLSAQAELAQAEREASKQRSKIERERKKQKAEEAKRSVTPEPADGRKHIEIQTEQYLEELTDKVEENTVDTQTDPMMDRPPTPLFVPFKTGRDTETQIAPDDLFDFDFEVEPMLEVLVGKTLEQAMLEVMQEEELEELRQQQLMYAQKRKEEELERQRLEAAEQRRYEEKQRRVKQEMERIKREKETKEKLASRMYAQQYLGNLEDRVFAKLEDQGWFHDVVEREVETQFVPWLMESMTEELEKKRTIHNLTMQLFRDVEKYRQG
jgi:hypothetical protein